jgi:hypothetical protein
MEGVPAGVVVSCGFLARGLGGELCTGYELEGLGLELLAVLVVGHVARVYSESERGAGQLSVSRTGRVSMVVVVEAQQWWSFKRFVQPGRPEIAEPPAPSSDIATTKPTGPRSSLPQLTTTLLSTLSDSLLRHDTMFKATRIMAMQPTRGLLMKQTAPLFMKRTPQLYMQQTARLMRPMPVSSLATPTMESIGCGCINANWCL